MSRADLARRLPEHQLLVGRTQDVAVSNHHLDLTVTGLGVTGLNGDALRDQGLGQFIEQFTVRVQSLDARVVAVIARNDGTVFPPDHEVKLVFKRSRHLQVSLCQSLDHPLEKDPRAAGPGLTVTSHEIGHDFGVTGEIRGQSQGRPVGPRPDLTDGTEPRLRRHMIPQQHETHQTFGEGRTGRGHRIDRIDVDRFTTNPVGQIRPDESHPSDVVRFELRFPVQVRHGPLSNRSA